MFKTVKIYQVIGVHHNMIKRRLTKQSKGFTLVELLVSMTIFTIVMVSAIGSVYVANSSAKRAQSMGVVLSNLDFAVESNGKA